MITEVTRILSAWAEHPTNGVNAQLAHVERQASLSDPLLIDDAPPAVTIYNDIDSVDGNEPGLSQDLEPALVPALVITSGEGTGITLDVTDSHYLKDGGPITVDFAYVVRDTPVRQARLDGMYTLRALRRSLWRIGRRGKENERKLNGIQVLYVGEVSIYQVSGGVGRSQMFGFARAAVHVTDTTP